MFQQFGNGSLLSAANPELSLLIFRVGELSCLSRGCHPVLATLVGLACDMRLVQ